MGGRSLVAFGAREVEDDLLGAPEAVGAATAGFVAKVLAGQIR